MSVNQVKVKFIYNPKAGAKRRIFQNFSTNQTSLEEIKSLLKKYEIIADDFPTKAPGHATELAKNASSEGYKMVIVAGGDGTVGEAANGLIHSDIVLAIIPFGSFMNIARMLSIPQDLEKAVQLIKIGRIRKIDVGAVTSLNGEKLNEANFFLESCGFGMEAQLHENFLEWEKGNPKALFKVVKTFFDYYGHRAKITLDHKAIIETRASLVTVSNGPFTGAAIPIAPKAKLNDHRLTVTLYKMSKFELIKYFLGLLTSGKRSNKKVTTYQAKEVKIESKSSRLVHADARLFGQTPVELEVVPNALSVITGFPKTDEDSALRKRTYLRP